MTAAIVAADVFVFPDERRFPRLRLTADDGAAGLCDSARGGRELLVTDHLRRLADPGGVAAPAVKPRGHRSRTSRARGPLRRRAGPACPAHEPPRTRPADRRLSLPEVGDVTAARTLADQAAKEGARVVSRNPP